MASLGLLLAGSAKSVMSILFRVYAVYILLISRTLRDEVIELREYLHNTLYTEGIQFGRISRDTLLLRRLGF